MAVKPSAFSCVFSLLKPFRAAAAAAQPLTAAEDGGSSPAASPKTSIFPREVYEDASTSSTEALEHQRQQQQQQRVFVVSPPPVSPFMASVEKQTTSFLIDPSSFLIERLDKGWFEENVVGITGWWDICSNTLSWPGGGGGGGGGVGSGQGWQAQPTTSDLMAWVPSNLSDSELTLGPPLRIRTSNLGSSSQQQHLFPAIEMASTSGNSLPTHSRDPAGLPGSRLRKLPRIYTDNKISLSDGEQRHHRPRSIRTRREDTPEALQQFSDKQSKIRNSTKKMEKPAGKLDVGSSDKERRRAQKDESSPMAGAPTRRRRKDRKKVSLSLAEGEFDEFRGSSLSSTGDYYTPPVTREFPGLKFYTDGDDSRHQSPIKPSHRSRFRSPKEWLRHPDSPLLKSPIPSNLNSDVDMKAHLKFWAHSVASTVSAEC
ncbi:unnamed protein product [Calypogeia fissa]